MKIIEFKTVSPLFEMERDGIKPFTTRQLERGDKRWDLLMDVLYLGTGVVIKITNPQTGESFTRPIKHVTYVAWTRSKWLNIHWKHLKLVTPDKEGK
jgi:hypothetical protein